MASIGTALWILFVVPIYVPRSACFLYLSEPHLEVERIIDSHYEIYVQTRQ